MRALFVISLVAMTGCVHRYVGAPPLPFSDFDYSGPKGQAWPLKTVELDGAKTRYALGRAPKLRYVELNPEGQKAIIFLHGLGSYLKFWRSQLDVAAAAGYRVIAIDQLGFGKSEKPAEFPYSTESFGENVVELMDILKIEQAILIGHSMGGQTALSTAIRFPNRVEALVLVSPAGFETFSPREKKWFKNVFASTFVKSGDEETIWANIRTGNFRHWTPELEWLVEERVRVVGTADFDSYAYAQVRTVEGLTMNDFVRESLSKVTAPTLILYGTSDHLIPNPFLHGGFPKDIFEIGHKGIVGSTLVGLNDCGHTLQLDCPDAANTEIFQFLSAKAPSVSAAPVAPVSPPAEAPPATP